MNLEAMAREAQGKREAQSSKLKAQGKGQAPSSKTWRSGSGLRINLCETSCRNRWTKKRIRLPRPVRHERGEGRGEGCFTIARVSTLRSASAPQLSPPFRTEERETVAPVRTARTFSKTDYHSDFPNRPNQNPSRRAPIVACPLALPLSFELCPWSFPASVSIRG